MEMYLLKASAILAIFLGIYQLLLKNETFFRLNRFFLLSGLLAATLLPFVSIQQEVFVPLKAAVTESPGVLTSVEPIPEAYGQSLLWSAYALGVLVLLSVLGRQLWQLRKMIRQGEKVRKDAFLLVPNALTKAPFSFFRYIFFNPGAHSPEELELILEHEKAHGRQLHSIDILLGRMVAVILWANPLVWWYQKSIQQNLEYLADAQAIRQVPSVRAYQYTLLKVSGNPLTPALVNPFYSSLIKKRIVMLQQSQSKTIHLLKYLLVVPVLALFLMAFSRETVYVSQEPSTQEMFSAQKTFEAIINKNTTDAELLNMKELLKKDNVDFSYTTVRNDAGEIIDISFDFKGKADNGSPFSGSYSSDSDGPIKPIMIQINSAGGIFFGEVGAHKEVHQGKELHFDSNSGNTMVWVEKSGGAEGEEVIEIRKEDGKEIIILNGEEITREELHEAGDSKKVVVKVLGEGDDTSEVEVQEIRIIGADSDDQVIEFSTSGDKTKYKTVIIDKEKSGDYDNLHIISADGEEPLFIIDGKKAKQKDASKLDPDQIETINVLKGDAAVKKYGNKAKNGVVEITTKKQ